MPTRLCVLVLFLTLVPGLGVCQPATSDAAAQADKTAVGKIELRPQSDTAGVQMKLPGLDGEVGLTLPELINDDTRRIVYTDTNLKFGIKWRQLADGSLSGEWGRDGVAKYRIDAVPEPDGVRLRWTITNLGQDDWKNAAGNICMRSTGVPALFHNTGERVFLRREGHWVAARDTGDVRATWFLPPGREVLPLMRVNIEDGSYKISDFRPDEAIIAVQTADRAYVLAQAWDQSRYLLANLQRKYLCTEAPPFFGVRVPPGATVVARGKIYFLKGSLDDLETKYKSDLRRGVIRTTLQTK